jgi:hypothetical protein
MLDDLLAGDTAEVAMIVGEPHRNVPVELDEWHPAGSGLRHHPALDVGDGRVLIEHIATEYLDATIVDVAVP